MGQPSIRVFFFFTDELVFDKERFFVQREDVISLIGREPSFPSLTRYEGAYEYSDAHPCVEWMSLMGGHDLSFLTLPPPRSPKKIQSKTKSNCYHQAN